MVPDLQQLRASHAGGEELAQPFSGLPALIFDVLWVDVVDNWGLAYLHTVKSQDKLESHHWALHSSWTHFKVALSKCLSLLRNRPLLSICEVIEFVVIGYCIEVVDLPVTLLMVCQARRLECIKVMDSTVSVHLSLHLSLSLVKRLFAASSLTSLVSASLLMCSRSYIHHPSMECSLCIRLEVYFSWRQLAASCSTICRHVQVGGEWKWEASSSIVGILCELFPVCFLEVSPLDTFSFNRLN